MLEGALQEAAFPPAYNAQGVGQGWRVFFSTVSGQYPPLNREKAREILEAAKMCSHDKAYRYFGYAPQIALEDGVRETIAWYKEAGWLT